MVVTFHKQTVSNTIYGQFITHPHMKLHARRPTCTSAVAIKGKSETQVQICCATIYWFHIFGQTPTVHFPNTLHQTTRVAATTAGRRPS